MKDIQVFGLKSAGGTSEMFPIGINVDDEVKVSASGTISVTGSISSVVAVGPTAADAADGGNAPVQEGGVARQTNPTAVADGDVVKASYDDLGRQITVPFQVRDLVATAAATLSNSAAAGGDCETTLVAATSGAFNDLLWVSMANSSANAIRIVFRDSTAGTDLFDMSAAANSTTEMHFPTPWPQSLVTSIWRVDFAANASIVDPNDVTNTTVKVSALFAKNV